jgi:hypothetical protein
MVERIAGAGGRHRHADATRKQREHMRGALHELLHIADAVEVLLDRPFVLVRDVRVPGQLLDVITIGLRRGHPARRGVRLLEKSGLGQVGHDVADTGRAQSFFIRARKRTRSHRLARGYERLHDGRQNLTLTLARWPNLRHFRPF